MEGADKLLKLQIKVGEENRQIVAGIAEHYSPEELVGKKIVVVANLKPAVIRGVESNGMLLAVSTKDSVILVTPEDTDVPSGLRISWFSIFPHGAVHDLLFTIEVMVSIKDVLL